MRKNKHARKKEDVGADPALKNAVKRQRVRDDLSRRTEELTALQATILDISSPHKLSKLLNLIVERATTLLGAVSGGLYLTEPEQRKVRCVVSYKTKKDYTGTMLDYGVGAAGQVAETGKPLIIDDYVKWSGRANVYDKDQPFHAVMSAPMIWQGRVSGVIHVLRDAVAQKFTPEELNLLMMFADHAAVAVENARLLDAHERELVERKKIEAELQAQRDFATQVINAMGQGLTVTNAGGRFEFVNSAYARMFGYEPADLIGKNPQDVTLPEDRAALNEQREMRQAGKATTYESRLLRVDGSVAPVLITGVPRERHGKYAGAIAVITDLTEQKRVEDELRRAKAQLLAANQKLEQALEREKRLARTDELTGVANRRYLFELAEAKFTVALRYQQPLSAILFDIDHFKKINDTFGHATGDQVLAQVVKTVSAELRNADLIGRYGGEEFVVLLPMTNAAQAYALAERIRLKVAANVFATISLGIAELAHVSPPDTIEDVFNRADEAMYRAKQSGRNCTAIRDKNGA